MNIPHSQFRRASLALVTLAGPLARNVAVADASHEWVTHRFQEVDTLFANPGQGWMSTNRTPLKPFRFPCSVVYVRFD
jgi:hypothetical protein